MSKREKIAWIAILLLATAHFSLSYVVNHGSNFSLADYTHGRAATPYQYRVLCMWIMRALTSVPGWGRIASRLPLIQNDPYKLALLPVVFLCMIGAMLFAARSAKLLGSGERVCMIAAALVLYMSYFSLDLNYVQAFLTTYDVPSLFLFSVCIYAALRHKWILYYALFGVATLNRETTVLLLVFVAVCMWEEGGAVVNGIVEHAVIHVVIWLSIVVTIHHFYRLNPSDTTVGGFFNLSLWWNLKEILKPWQWPVLGSVFGFALPVYAFRFRRITSFRLSAGSAAMLVAWFIGMMLTAKIIEIRVFTEMNLFMALALAATWRKHAVKTWVIFDNPQDKPFNYAVDEWREVSESAPVREAKHMLYESLDAARSLIPAHAERRERYAHEGPAVLEVWTASEEVSDRSDW